MQSDHPRESPHAGWVEWRLDDLGRWGAISPRNARGKQFARLDFLKCHLVHSLTVA